VTNGPVPVLHDLTCEASLAIEPMQGRLRVSDDGFDLDDEQRAEYRMERQHVDRAPLTPDRELDLDLHRPAESRESPDQCVDQRRVRFVEQAIELLAAPSEAQVQVGAERTGRPNERANGHAVDLAPIDRSDQRPRQARVSGDV
jgi:hypothetical protein